MRRRAASLFGWLFDARLGPSDRLRARWLFLRALAAIYFSAFYSLVFQIHGLIGPQGILPAQSYLQTVAQSLGHWERLWYAPERALDVERFGNAQRALLDRYGGVHSPFSEPVAAWNAGDLFCTVPVVRECGAGFFQLSVGWNAARGWVHQPVFRASWGAPGIGSKPSADLEPACFCCSGSGFAFISKAAW